MFGFVGAMVAGFRAIIQLIADNCLAPRDFLRMQLGLAVGLVAGVAVGLFLSPTSVVAQGDVNSQTTLTASGLAFLAGYAAERFFRYLDNLASNALPNATERGDGGKPAS